MYLVVLNKLLLIKCNKHLSFKKKRMKNANKCSTSHTLEESFNLKRSMNGLIEKLNSTNTCNSKVLSSNLLRIKDGMIKIFKIKIKILACQSECDISDDWLANYIFTLNSMNMNVLETPPPPLELKSFIFACLRMIVVV